MNWRKDFSEAKVSADCELGSNVRVGPNTIVYPEAIIEDDTVIGECCVIGHPSLQPGIVRIGPGSIVRSHTVIYSGSTFGSQLETGHHVVIREHTIAGENLRVGNFSDVEGDCVIGDYCRFHGYVHVGKGTWIGNFVWLFSLSTLTNDPLPPSELQEPVRIEDGAVVCVGVTLMPGAVVGKGAFLCAGSIARGVIPPAAVVDGREGRIVNHVSHLLHLSSGMRHPWMQHYHKGYPVSAIARLETLKAEILANRFTLDIELGSPET